MRSLPFRYLSGFVLSSAVFAVSSQAAPAPAAKKAPVLRTDGHVFPSAPTIWSLASGGITKIAAATNAYPVSGLKIQLRDGKTGAVLNPQTPAVSPDGKSLKQRYRGSALTLQQGLMVDGDQLLWSVELQNPGKGEAWVELGLQATLQATGDLQFWDGYETRPVAKEPLQRDDMGGTFPATALLWKNRALVIGVQPDADISSLFSRLDPATKRYYYGTRFVIPAGKAARLRFTLFTLAPRFGALDAIQGYYNRYPSYFRANPGVDPRLAGFRGAGGSYVPLNHFTGRQDPKIATIAGLGSGWASWDWGYAPFKWVGDWIGREEYWNLPASKGDTATIEKKSKEGLFDLLDIAQFRRDRKELFRRNDLRGNVDLPFYIIDFGDEELLKKNGWMKYTYPYNSKTEEPSSARIKNWVTGFDTTWHIYPWATPWESTFRRDLPEVLRQLDTNSFAIDLYSDSTRYRGETDYYQQGWSYDAKGKFINTNIAHKKLVNFIHTLRKERFQAGVVGNNTLGETTHGEDTKLGNFVSIFAPDSYLWEGNVSYVVNYNKPHEMFPNRYLLGGKLITNSGGGYADKIGEIIPWQAMSPNQVRRAFDKYLKTRIIAFYQAGLVPDYNMSRGIESHIRVLPTLLDVLSRGFQAVPASFGNKSIERRRYGNGVGAAIVYSNPTDNALSGDETVLNSYIARAALIPVDYFGAPLKFQADATRTLYPLHVPSLENKIVTLPLSLAAATPVKLSGQSSGEFKADRLRYDITLQSAVAVKVNLHFVAPRDFVLQGWKLNGQVPKSWNQVPLKSGKNTLQIIAVSRDFKSSEEQLSQFDFKNASIVLPAAPTERERAAAQMLADYVAFYHKTTPPIGNAAGSGPHIVIGTGKSRGVAVAGNELRLTGSDPYDTQQLAWRLIRLITRRNPYMPIPQWTNTSTKAMLNKIGLITNMEGSYGKIIDDEALKPVPGQDSGGMSGAVDFAKIEPLPRADWVVTASAEFVKGANNSIAKNALDNKAGSFWTPGTSANGQWIMVDMRSAQEFNHVQLKSSYPYVGYPRGYKLEASDDGTTWRELAQGAGDKVTDIFLPKMESARYLRVTSTDSGGKWWTVDEFLVYRRAPRQAAVETVAVTPTRDLPQTTVPQVANAAIRLDGNFDEAAWQQGALIDKWNSTAEKTLTQRTEVRAICANDSLYLAVSCFEENMDKLWEDIRTHDGPLWDGDDVEIYLAPGRHEGELKFPYFQFLLSPNGTKTELRVGEKADLGWNGAWDVATAKQADRWTAEIRIPLATLEAAGVHEFRFNLARLERPNGEISSWAPISGILARPERFGVLRLQ